MYTEEKIEEQNLIVDLFSSLLFIINSPIVPFHNDF